MGISSSPSSPENTSLCSSPTNSHRDPKPADPPPPSLLHSPSSPQTSIQENQYLPVLEKQINHSPSAMEENRAYTPTSVINLHLFLNNLHRHTNIGL
ncbi:UNVERIFIED_CONTAM: hypothetical protein Slati_1383200 [Sesamum latifolium]|uniref:Uncharacterized protein n=1 Tax=Sesamum latifolium TaxID=2727402 RepID=A0AAW2X3J3_9LAMI